jgi:hypothetical protein
MNGNRHFFKIFQFQFPFAFVYFFFGIAIPIPILFLELGFHESTTELGQLLISEYFEIQIFFYFLIENFMLTKKLWMFFFHL